MTKQYFGGIVLPLVVFFCDHCEKTFEKVVPLGTVHTYCEFCGDEAFRNSNESYRFNSTGLPNGFCGETKHEDI
jgi:hypothetical protein